MSATRLGRAALLALPLLAGCAAGLTQPEHGPVVLPRGAFLTTDPMRTAINNTADALNKPYVLAGRPADAARAVAQYEYLAADLPFSTRGQIFNPVVGLELSRGLRELRPAAGIAPEAASQPVVLALFAAADALERGDSAAAERFLDAPVFPAGGAATLQRLANLGPVPQAGSAALLASAELARLDTSGRHSHRR